MLQIYGQTFEDDWVEVTACGDTEPRFLRGWSARDKALAFVREKFECGEIDVTELEKSVAFVLTVRDA